jgi:hypothetical protein
VLCDIAEINPLIFTAVFYCLDRAIVYLFLVGSGFPFLDIAIWLLALPSEASMLSLYGYSYQFLIVYSLWRFRSIEAFSEQQSLEHHCRFCFPRMAEVTRKLDSLSCTEYSQ